MSGLEQPSLDNYVVSTTTPIAPLNPVELSQDERNSLRDGYLHRLLVAFDQALNVLTDGDPDETISSRAARAAEKGKPWGIELCRFLNRFERDHGPIAQASDLERAKTIEALEDSSGGFEK